MGQIEQPKTESTVSSNLEEDLSLLGVGPSDFASKPTHFESFVKLAADELRDHQAGINRYRSLLEKHREGSSTRGELESRIALDEKFVSAIKSDFQEKISEALRREELIPAVVGRRQSIIEENSLIYSLEVKRSTGAIERLEQNLDKVDNFANNSSYENNLKHNEYMLGIAEGRLERLDQDFVESLSEVLGSQLGAFNIPEPGTTQRVLWDAYMDRHQRELDGIGAVRSKVESAIAGVVSLPGSLAYWHSEDASNLVDAITTRLTPTTRVTGLLPP